MINLKDENFYQYALQGLNTNAISESEFRLLLKHIVYIKRLLKKYKDNFINININLLLNHFIILYNEFDIKVINHILFFDLLEIYYPQLKTISLFLKKIKEDDSFLINDKLIIISEIKTDQILMSILRQATSK